MVVLTWGSFCPPRDVGQSLETFLVLQLAGMLVGREKPGILLNGLQLWPLHNIELTRPSISIGRGGESLVTPKSRAVFSVTIQVLSDTLGLMGKDVFQKLSRRF